MASDEDFRAEVKLEKRIGAGCFAQVFKAVNMLTDKQVAVKLEDRSTNAPQLEWEYEVTTQLAEATVNPQGFAVPCKFFGGVSIKGKQWNALVMPLLGLSMEDKLQSRGGQFTVQETLMFAEQMLRRIEYLHALGIIHRDIKPENFMLGRDAKQHIVHLADFGLSKRYYDGDKHAPLRQKLSLTGTARYASVNAHRGVEQSRRDDVEALGHMFAYFLRGSLPWSGLDAKTKQEKYRKIMEVKSETPLGALFEGYPACFEEYLGSARLLNYEEQPKYGAYREAFRNAFREAGFVDDSEGVEPAEEWKCPAQPDIKPEPAKKGFWAKWGDACDAVNKINENKQAEADRSTSLISNVFVKWDANGDGGLDRNEFRDVLIAIGLPSEDVNMLFDKADLDQNEKIDFNEFLTWVQGDAPQVVREEVYALHGDYEPPSTDPQAEDRM